MWQRRDSAFRCGRYSIFRIIQCRVFSMSEPVKQLSSGKGKGKEKLPPMVEPALRDTVLALVKEALAAERADRGKPGEGSSSLSEAKDGSTPEAPTSCIVSYNKIFSQLAEMMGISTAKRPTITKPGGYNRGQWVATEQPWRLRTVALNGAEPWLLGGC